VRVGAGSRVIPIKTIPLPVDYLMSAESVPGRMYEIHVVLKNKANEESARKLISILPDEFIRRFNAKVNYVEVNDNYVRIQLTGSPFPWSAVLLFLPQIFMIVGLIVSLIAVFLLITKAPWEAAAAIVGIALMVAGYLMSRGGG